MLRKIIVVSLMIIFFFWIGWMVFIHLSYSSYMPHTPQPESGRVHAVTVNHGNVVYVTQQELRRAEFVLHDAFYFGMGSFLLLGIIKVYWK